MKQPDFEDKINKIYNSIIADAEEMGMNTSGISFHKFLIKKAYNNAIDVWAESAERVWNIHSGRFIKNPEILKNKIE